MKTWQALLGLFGLVIAVAPSDLNPLLLWEPYRMVINGFLMKHPQLWFAVWMSALFSSIYFGVRSETQHAHGVKRQAA